MTWSRGSLLTAVLVAAALAAPARAQESGGLGRLFKRPPAEVAKGAEAVAEDGPVTKVCGLRGGALGQQVAEAPGGWTLHDVAPGSMSPRAFHVTGFADRCPREITGAVAVFGSAELYELLHFGPLKVAHRDDDVAQAYGALRQKACGSATAPCSEKGQAELARTVVFVNVYPVAGSDDHVDMLLSGGKLVAVTSR